MGWKANILFEIQIYDIACIYIYIHVYLQMNVINDFSVSIILSNGNLYLPSYEQAKAKDLESCLLALTHIDNMLVHYRYYDTLHVHAL